jgi:hypothetical protein
MQITFILCEGRTETLNTTLVLKAVLRHSLRLLTDHARLPSPTNLPRHAITMQPTTAFRTLQISRPTPPPPQPMDAWNANCPVNATPQQRNTRGRFYFEVPTLKALQAASSRF